MLVEYQSSPFPKSPESDFSAYPGCFWKFPLLITEKNMMMMMMMMMMMNAPMLKVLFHQHHTPKQSRSCWGILWPHQTSGLPTYWSFICQQRSGSKESQDLRSTVAREKESDALVALNKSSHMYMPTTFLGVSVGTLPEMVCLFNNMCWMFGISRVSVPGETGIVGH